MTEVFSFRWYELPVDLVMLTGGGPDNFGKISDVHQTLLKRWIDLKPGDDVIEIGCGIGRDAIPLSTYLETGSYLGIDIIGPSIAWCSANIAARHPNMRFVHFDVQDQLHNSGGTSSTQAIRLPVEDASIDKIFLFSVFTHMLRDDIVHYLKEFKRVLRPDGLVYATTFIYNDAILECAQRTNLTRFNLRFEHEMGEGCRINDPDAPLGAVAYTAQAWDEMIAAAGLRQVQPMLKGAWSGYYAQYQEGQDVALLGLP